MDKRRMSARPNVVHDNLSERAPRIVALQRKNALFAGGDGPAQT